MTQDTWTAVDRLFAETLRLSDAATEAALAASAAAGLPEIQVSPAQGKQVHVLALAVRARRILEIGTLGGYSAIWLARALPEDGRLVTLELDPRHAQVARENIERAGLSARVEVRVGPAIETLAAMGEHDGPFDLVFIDADKQSSTEYFDHALRLSRPGTLIVVDNAVRGGRVADPVDEDESARGMRRLLERLRDERRVAATGVQTVGEKGYDGYLIATVLEPAAG